MFVVVSINTPAFRSIGNVRLPVNDRPQDISWTTKQISINAIERENSTDPFKQIYSKSIVVKWQEKEHIKRAEEG